MYSLSRFLNQIVDFILSPHSFCDAFLKLIFRIIGPEQYIPFLCQSKQREKESETSRFDMKYCFDVLYVVCFYDMCCHS